MIKQGLTTQKLVGQIGFPCFMICSLTLFRLSSALFSISLTCWLSHWAERSTNSMLPCLPTSSGMEWKLLEPCYAPSCIGEEGMVVLLLFFDCEAFLIFLISAGLEFSEFLLKFRLFGLCLGSLLKVDFLQTGIEDWWEYAIPLTLFCVFTFLSVNYWRLFNRLIRSDY